MPNTECVSSGKAMALPGLKSRATTIEGNYGYGRANADSPRRGSQGGVPCALRVERESPCVVHWRSSQPHHLNHQRRARNHGRDRDAVGPRLQHYARILGEHAGAVRVGRGEEQGPEGVHPPCRRIRAWACPRLTLIHPLALGSLGPPSKVTASPKAVIGALTDKSKALTHPARLSWRPARGSRSASARRQLSPATKPIRFRAGITDGHG